MRVRSCHSEKVNSEGEAAIVAFQTAVKHATQSDTILEISATGDSQANGAAEHAAREEEGTTRAWTMYVGEKLNAVMNRFFRGS